MNKLINIEDILYVLVSNVNDDRLLKDIVNLKENINDFNITKLPLKAVKEILDTYKIENKEEILNKLTKEEINE